MEVNFVTVCFEVETKSVDHVRICNCDRSYEIGSYLIFDFFFPNTEDQPPNFRYLEQEANQVVSRCGNNMSLRIEYTVHLFH